MNETTDERGFGVRQLAAAFVRAELLQLGQGASKLAAQASLRTPKKRPEPCVMNLRPAGESTMKQPTATLLVRDLPPPATGFTVEVISDYRAFLGLESSWNDLVHRAGIDHPFLTHEWVRTWWQCFGSGKT